MPARRSRPVLPVLALGLALGLAGALAGCSASRDDAASGSDASSSPRPTATTTVTVTPLATPSTSASPTASPTASATPTTTPSAATTPTTPGPLLVPAELPRYAGSQAWTQERSGPASTAPFGLCQKTDLLSVGAESAAERGFSAGRNTAAEQVARFADARTALRTDKVLQSWRADCSDRVRASAVRVSPLRSVSVPSGAAWQYTVTYEVGGDVHAHTLGVVRRGSTLALVRLDLADQADDSAPIPADLVAPVLRTAAARLG